MEDCENCSRVRSCSTVEEMELKFVLREIERLFEEHSVFDYASTEGMYHYLKKHHSTNATHIMDISKSCVASLEFGWFVSEEHVNDEDSGYTYYVIAKDKEAYDEYEKDIEHQHICQDGYGT